MQFQTHSEFQLNNNFHNIHNKKLLPLLEEVWQCFMNGLYRQTVISTYTSLIYDLLMKVEYLSAAEEDSDATETLRLIKEKRELDPHSSVWENILLEECFNKIGILNHQEIEEISTIKKYRNLAAHPSFIWDNQEITNILIKDIRRETALLCIRYAYDASFSKTPQTSKFEFEYFISELNNLYESYTIDSLKSVIKNRFITKLNNKALIKFIKSLWMICFKVDNEECRKNRLANCRILQIFIDEKPELLTFIIENQDYFFNKLSFNIEKLNYSDSSELIETHRKSCTQRLISFCQANTPLWLGLKNQYKSLLCEATKNYFGNELLSKSIDDSDLTEIQLRLQAKYLSRSPYLFFDNNNFDDYIQALKKIRTNYIPRTGYVDLSVYNYLNSTDLELIIKFCRIQKRTEDIFEFFVEHLSESRQYTQAETNFEIIAPYLSEFSLSNQKNLLLAFERKKDFYNNRRIQYFIQESLKKFSLHSKSDIESLIGIKLINIEKHVDAFFDK